MEQETIIWHYTSMEAFIQIVNNGALRFSKATGLNDSREITWINSIGKKVLYERRDGLTDNQVSQLKDCIPGEELLERASPYVASFSTHSDKLSQWRAYADDGKGIAIGFGLESLMRNMGNCHNHKGLTFFHQEIQYIDSSATSKTIFDVFDLICNSIQKQYPIEGDDGRIHYKANYFVKNSSFEEEEEYRICYDPRVYTKDAILLNVSHRVDINSRLVPYIDIKINKEAEKVPIIHIMLGPKNVNSERRIKDFLWAHNNLNPTIDISSSTYR